MADGPALALQGALVAALRADAGVAAQVGARVYDEPPQHVTFPYVRIGLLDVAPLRLSGDCTDEDIMVSIEAHSRPVAGRVEAARIAHIVRLALDDAPLTVTGYTLDWCTWMTQAVTRAADGKSYIAVLAFQVALSPAEEIPDGD